MSTWLDHWDRRYTDRVRLLVEILPVLAQEPGFALKGGTAINLFIRDLPRLSVDIDLTYLPVAERAESLAGVTSALNRIADRVRARTGGRVDLTFVPEHRRIVRVPLGPVGVELWQMMGRWSGTLVDDAGAVVALDGLFGLAEEMKARW